MVKAVIIFAIAVVVLALAYKIKAGYIKDENLIKTYEQTYAAVERVVFSDTGNAKYYVSFTVAGERITAETGYYSSETKSLNSGDKVRIGYYFARGGAPWAVIFDDRVTAVSGSVPAFYKGMTVLGMLLLLISIAMFVKWKLL